MTMKHLSHSKNDSLGWILPREGFDLLALVLVSVLPFGLGLGSQSQLSPNHQLGL